MAPNKTIKQAGAAFIFLMVFFLGRGVHAETLLIGGTDLESNAASSYSDNGAGFKIDTATAPWKYGPYLFSPSGIRLWLFTYSGHGPCTTVAYVEISSNGTDWNASGTQAVTVEDSPQSVLFTFTGPYTREGFAYVRLRRSSGSCGVGSTYFMVHDPSAQAWNMVPPTGTDLADAGFVIVGGVISPDSAPLDLTDVFTGGSTTEENLCPETVEFTGGESGTWGSLADFFAAFLPSLQNSLWGFFFVNCETLKPISDLRNELLLHAPFRQSVWLAVTVADAIDNTTATDAAEFVIQAPPPFDDGSLTIFDADAIYDLFGGAEGWGALVRPLLAVVTLLALAFYFWHDAQEFFTGQ